MVTDWTMPSPARSSTSSSTTSSGPPFPTTPSRRSCVPNSSGCGRMRFWRSRAGSTCRSICGVTSPSRIPPSGRAFQCAAFHLTRDGAKPQDGYLCVTSWNNKFVKLRLTTLSDTNTEAPARKFVSAWVPVLWGAGGTSRAEQVKPEPQPRAESRAQQRAQAPRRPAVRRAPACPQGYICEYR